MNLIGVSAGSIELEQRIERAAALGPELMAAFLARACTRLLRPELAAKAVRINRLIELAAWTEATLVILECELPQWRLKRIMLEEGTWQCQLSRQWKLPDWLADSVETRHESMPLAILAAMIEARRCEEPVPQPPASSVPCCRGQVAGAEDAMILSCDNFA